MDSKYKIQTVANGLQNDLIYFKDDNDEVKEKSM